MKQDADRIVRAAIRAVDPGAAIRRTCRRDDNLLYIGDRAYDLSGLEHVYIIGAGKAGAPMTAALEELLGERVTGGVVCVKYGHSESTRFTRIMESGHPVPDENGVMAARKILETARLAGERDLVLCVLSGGGSALTPLPVSGITLEEKQEATRVLLASGATIHEINTIRKHISDFKGGNLARAAYPAHLVSLILSDVVGDDPDVIASGPTSPDSSTYEECQRIFERREIADSIPESIRTRILLGARGRIPETPKPGDPVFLHTQNLIVGSNRDAVLAAASEANRLGYKSLILSTRIEGEAKEVARVLAAVAKEIVESGHPIAPPACILSGGETTVTLKGDGLGGRNTEFVLASAMELAGWNSVVTVSVGTDGADGPTDAAGAICDGATVRKAKEKGLDPESHLSNNDSYRFFEQTGGLIRTGPTKTNVMDVRFSLVGNGEVGSPP
ncbi:MAG: glycerate kinase [Deltaproteobacteria bacterium]|nr:glycerate kinase [Deltaproteobacteria bacterium]